MSRAIGVRVIAIGAVLGPTFFANTYQLTNSLPNLIYYASWGISVLVAARPGVGLHIDARNPEATTRVASASWARRCLRCCWCTGARAPLSLAAHGHVCPG